VSDGVADITVGLGTKFCQHALLGRSGMGDSLEASFARSFWLPTGLRPHFSQKLRQYRQRVSSYEWPTQGGQTTTLNVK
jgi:hypothetical protein